MGRQAGQIELLALLLVAFAFAYFVAGGVFPFGQDSSSTQTSTTSSPAAGACCDTQDCSLVPNSIITWNGVEYGLLKSSIGFTEGVTHFNPARPPNEATASTGEYVFLNDSSLPPLDHSSIGCPAGMDLLWLNVSARRCFAIPDNAIIYICKGTCAGPVGSGRFDAYYRVDDLPIPEEIRNCDTTQFGLLLSDPRTAQVANTLVCPTGTAPGEQLQLRTCTVQQARASVPWFSPYCKPAIYLYPEQQSQVDVDIAPKGKVTLTIPTYPRSGWSVIAKPSGEIMSGFTSYDYLYYEAEIPDSLIEKPSEGFMVKTEELSKLFDDLLPKLGLNEKESSQFSEYWLKALPKSNYYFVGIVSTKNLDAIAPLTINPVPKTTIRVTLYFQGLDDTQSVTAPTITPVKRDGFTAVEWGGIVKTDPTHSFSCLM